MCNTQVVAGGYAVVMAHETLVASRQILLRVAVQVAAGRRKLSLRCSRGAPPSAHSAFCGLGQRDKALAAEHNMDMLEASERQPEVVKPMPKHDTCDRDAECARVG